MQTSKTLKRILVIVLTAIFTLLGIFAMNFCLTRPSLTELYVHHVNELKEKGENVDMIFVGASRMYHGLNPDVFEEELGFDHVLNNATPSQRAVFTYYMLEDTLQNFKPKYALIGTTYNGLMFDQGYHNFTLAMNRLPLINRIRCVADVYGLKEGLMVMSGKTEYLSDENFGHAYKYVKNKIDRYRGINNTENNTKDTRYNENGYVEEFLSLPQGSIDYGYGEDRPFRTEDINPKNLEYLEKSIKMCEEHGVQPILFTGVCTTARMYSVENYQEVVEFFSDLAAKYNTIYVNMNYIKDREKLFPDTVFIDNLHVNDVGGEIQSEIFAKIFKDYIEGKSIDHYFYKDFDDMAKDVHRIPGCVGIANEGNGKLFINMESVHNQDVVPEYRVVAGINDKDTTVTLTDWTVKSKFGYSSSKLKEYDYLKVEVRSGEPGEDYAYKIFNLREEEDK